MQKKDILNPVIYDHTFQQAFANRPIKLVAPASGIDPANIEKIRTINQLNIEIPKNIMEDSIVFHANSDEKRFKFLKAALFDRSKKTIVWTLRGGYGSARLINQLETLPIPKQEKTFIGFSDITALHLFLSQRWGWKTIHGSGLSEIVFPNKDPKNLEKIADIVANRVATAEINHLVPLNTLAKKSTKISGRITGGNLSIVQTSLGTNWQIKTTGKIIFLEDTGEKGYKIDRILNHLKQASIFSKARAVVFGDFTDPQDEHVDLALERFATEIGIPVFKTHQFGHGKTNYPLIYNAKSEIIFSDDNQTFELKMHI